MEDFTRDELSRYSRHLSLKDFGIEGQRKLKNASILVVGAGGLGAPALYYLTAAGVGSIGTIDHDIVDISNLQRQILYTHDDLGKSKAETAKTRLARLNPLVKINSYQERITRENVFSLIENYDIILDGTDNLATRYLLNDACVLRDKVLIYGSVLKFEGQVAVFNALKKDGSRSCNYRDVFPVPPDPEIVPNCAEAGVIGVSPGIIGCLQANEAIKLITGIGEPLIDRLLLFDALTLEQQIIQLRDRHARDQIKALVDYDDFCGISQEKNKSLVTNQGLTMKEITVQELKKMKESGADFQLIDVREPHEFDICDIGGELIPMSEIPHNVDRISRDKQVVMHCRSGKRSGDMLLWLEKNHGFTNLHNLKGGILAWAKEIDPQMPTY